MKKLLIFLGALSAYGTDCTISDTVRTPFGGYFAGRIVVALNSPGSAQPLYSGSQTLTGWQTTIEVPATANGVVAFTLVCTDTITPSGTSYSARYQPTSGSGWAETWSPATGTTTIRAMRATTVPTPTTTFQPSQIVPGSNGQVLTTTAGATAWGSVPACATCVVTSGSYADPAWITSLAGSKVSGAVASSTLAATATALATPRTIAGVSFNGTANISIPSTGLSDTANLVRNNAANTYAAGSKQTFAHSATTAGLNVGVQAAAPSSPAQGDVFFNSTLTRKGVYDGTQWRYELYAPSSGTGVVSWDGTSLSASTTLSGLASVTSTSFTGSLTGNASTATALASTVASGRLWIGQGTGVPTSDSVICADTTNHRLGVGTCSPLTTLHATGAGIIGSTNPTIDTYFSLAVTQRPALDSFATFKIAPVAGSTRGWHFDVYDNSTTAQYFQIYDNTNAATRLKIYNSGNVSLGTTTDLGYGLHAANRGTNGNFLCFDPTATTGVSTCVFRAGQGQSTSAILSVRDYANTDIFRVKTAGTGLGDFDITRAVSVGASAISSGASDALLFAGTGAALGSGMKLLWSSTTNAAVALSTPDLSLSRASAGVLQVGDGGANANGYLSAARIGVGTASPSYPIQVTAAASADAAVRVLRTSTTNYASYDLADTGSFSASNILWQLGKSPGSQYFSFRTWNGSVNTDPLAINAATGSVMIGTTTDGNYKLDVANSGSSGTLRVYDQTATTGNTKEVIRAGAGQTTNLTEWQNNAGTVLVSVANTGIFSANRISITSDRIDIPLGTSSGLGVAFSGGVSIRGNGTDSVLLVNSAGTGYGLLQFGGTTNSFPALKRSSAILQARLADDSAYTDMQVSSIITKQTTPAASTDACTAGALWADATYIYACTASGTIKRATLASF